MKSASAAKKQSSHGQSRWRFAAAMVAASALLVIGLVTLPMMTVHEEEPARRRLGIFSGLLPRNFLNSIRNVVSFGNWGADVGRNRVERATSVGVGNSNNFIGVGANQQERSFQTDVLAGPASVSAGASEELGSADVSGGVGVGSGALGLSALGSSILPGIATPRGRRSRASSRSTGRGLQADEAAEAAGPTPAASEDYYGDAPDRDIMEAALDEANAAEPAEEDSESAEAAKPAEEGDASEGEEILEGRPPGPYRDPSAGTPMFPDQPEGDLPLPPAAHPEPASEAGEAAELPQASYSSQPRPRPSYYGDDEEHEQPAAHEPEAAPDASPEEAGEADLPDYTHQVTYELDQEARTIGRNRSNDTPISTGEWLTVEQQQQQQQAAEDGEAAEDAEGERAPRPRPRGRPEGDDSGPVKRSVDWAGGVIDNMRDRLQGLSTDIEKKILERDPDGQLFPLEFREETVEKKRAQREKERKGKGPPPPPPGRAGKGKGSMGKGKGKGSAAKREKDHVMDGEVKMASKAEAGHKKVEEGLLSAHAHATQASKWDRQMGGPRDSSSSSREGGKGPKSRNTQDS